MVVVDGKCSAWYAQLSLRDSGRGWQSQQQRNSREGRAQESLSLRYFCRRGSGQRMQSVRLANASQ